MNKRSPIGKPGAVDDVHQRVERMKNEAEKRKQEIEQRNKEMRKQAMDSHNRAISNMNSRAKSRPSAFSSLLSNSAPAISIQQDDDDHRLCHSGPPLIPYQYSHNQLRNNTCNSQSAYPYPPYSYPSDQPNYSPENCYYPPPLTRYQSNPSIHPSNPPLNPANQPLNTTTYHSAPVIHQSGSIQPLPISYQSANAYPAYTLNNSPYPLTNGSYQFPNSVPQYSPVATGSYNSTGANASTYPSTYATYPSVLPVVSHLPPSTPQSPRQPLPREKVEDGWSMLGEEAPIAISPTKAFSQPPDDSLLQPKLSSISSSISTATFSELLQTQSRPPENVNNTPKPKESLPTLTRLPILEEKEIATSMTKKESPKATETKKTGNNSAVSNVNSPKLPSDEIEYELDISMLIRFEDLSLGEALGSGQFGTVYAATWRGTTTVAVKTIHSHLSAENSLKDFAEEVKLWIDIKPHPNIVQFFGISTFGASLMIVTELLEGGSLLDVLRDSSTYMGREQLINIAKQIAAGMYHLHCANIVHRDLAARNILVGGWLPKSKSYIVKVTDFGLSRYCVGGGEQKTAIPYRWSAPESLSRGFFSTASDVWSFGVLVSEIFTRGKIPYGELKEEDLLKKFKAGYRMEKPVECPHDIYQVMNQCWALEPELRPSMQQLYASLEQLEKGSLLIVKSEAEPNQYLSISEINTSPVYQDQQNQNLNSKETAKTVPLSINATKVQPNYVYAVSDPLMK